MYKQKHSTFSRPKDIVFDVLTVLVIGLPYDGGSANEDRTIPSISIALRSGKPGRSQFLDLVSRLCSSKRLTVQV